MSKERELLARYIGYGLLNNDVYRPLVKATKELLAQPEQEPVGWWDEKLGFFKEKHFDQLQPLYTSSPTPEQFKPDWVNYKQGVSDGITQAKNTQSEQELMTDIAISQAYPDHYCDIENEAFKVGIKWYEKYVARIGVYSNE